MKTQFSNKYGIGATNVGGKKYSFQGTLSKLAIILLLSIMINEFIYSKLVVAGPAYKLKGFLMVTYIYNGASTLSDGSSSISSLMALN